jgi:hypothetical protein
VFIQPVAQQLGPRPGSRHEGARHGCSYLGRPVRPPETPHQSSERSPGSWPATRVGPASAYTLDLRMFYRWCEEHQLALFEITRTHIELYRTNSRSMVEPPPPLGDASHLGGRLPVLGGGGLHRASPAAHVRRSRLDHESHAAVGLDRSTKWSILDGTM